MEYLICPGCTYRNEAGSQRCARCGTALGGARAVPAADDERGRTRRCRSCGAENEAQRESCVSCGAELLPRRTPDPGPVAAAPATRAAPHASNATSAPPFSPAYSGESYRYARAYIDHLQRSAGCSRIGGYIGLVIVVALLLKLSLDSALSGVPWAGVLGLAAACLIGFGGYLAIESLFALAMALPDFLSCFLKIEINTRRGP